MVKMVTKRRVFKLSISREIVDREYFAKEYYNIDVIEKSDDEWDIKSLNEVIKHLKGIIKDARDKNCSNEARLWTPTEKLKEGISIEEENYINYSDIKEYENCMEEIESLKKINKNLDKAFVEYKEDKEVRYGTLKDIERTIAKDKEDKENGITKTMEAMNNPPSDQERIDNFMGRVGKEYAEAEEKGENYE